MAALLPIDTLRRQVLSSELMTAFERATDIARVPARPSLVMSWHIGADGRPVCQWMADAAAIRGLPPN